MITIDKIKIGNNQPPYVIAELSANHNGDISNALKSIKVAKKMGSECY